MNLYMRLLCIGLLLNFACLKFIKAEETDDLEQEDDEMGTNHGDADDVPPIKLDTGGGPQSMSFKPPDINEEEQHSNRIPSNLLCDGCLVVAYQLGTRLRGYQDLRYKKKPGKLAPESDIIDLVEDICKRQTFENYGLKAVNGVNRLSGPGTQFEKSPGMMQGGGRWPHRLSMICGELIGEVDEYDIYKYVMKEGEKSLHQFLCMNDEEEALNACSKEVPKDEL